MKPSEEATLPEPPLIVEQFCIQIFVDQMKGKGKLLSPHYAWNEPLVHNIAQWWLVCEVAKARIIASGEVILFIGCGTAAMGPTQDEALLYIQFIPITDNWAGKTVHPNNMWESEDYEGGRDPVSTKQLPVWGCCTTWWNICSYLHVRTGKGGPPWRRHLLK